MIQSYLTTAARNFRRNKLHTSINIIGLAVGIMASVLALLFALDEQSFDNFHSKRDRIVRLNKINNMPDGSTMLTYETSGMMGPTMVEEFPEVEKAVRFLPWFDEVVVSFEGRNFVVPSAQLAFADSTYFEVFDFNLLRGDARTVLDKPQSLVLTQSLAKSIFGDLDPVGRSVTGFDGKTFDVTGIVADPPRNSHMQFQGLMSWSTTNPQQGATPQEWMNNWIAQGITTYLLLDQPTSSTSLSSKLDKFMADHLPTRVDKYKLYIQPFTDVYLHSADMMGAELGRSGNQQYVNLFGMIAGFILLIACINYINIATSKATRRAREVGMRKSMGAARRQLVAQFMGESILLTLFSTFVAIGLLYMAIPIFNNLAGKTLTFSLLFDPRIIAGLVAITVLVGGISGLYPAFVVSSFQPAAVLRGTSFNRSSGSIPRQVLIVFQFAISITMIAGTLLIRDQVQYVLNKDLGFDKEHVMLVNLTDDVVAHKDVLVNGLNTQPGVVSVSTARSNIGEGTASTYVIPEGFNPDEIEVRMFPVDGNFAATYGLSMASGHFFEKGSASDSGSFIINEALMRRLKWDNPLAKTIKFNPESPAAPVIGVIKDFNFRSLHREVEPLLMWISGRNQSRMSIRFAGNPAPIISYLEEQWKTYEPRYPFRYTFVDQALASNYVAEQKLFTTVMTFAGISIMIACLGLYGLVSYTVEQRTKEFGIRKVLGASVANLNLMVNRRFILLVLIAAAIAIPVVIPFVDGWLDRFAFKVKRGPGVFILATMFTLVITFVAVSIQAIRVARSNPATSLRAE